MIRSAPKNEGEYQKEKAGTDWGSQVHGEEEVIGSMLLGVKAFLQLEPEETITVLQMAEDLSPCEGLLDLDYMITLKTDPQMQQDEQKQTEAQASVPLNGGH